jgi:hypothetical protein
MQMFQISSSPTRRNTASALTVLAAIGASGMVAEVASAAVVELEPTQGARGLNASYLGPGFPTNWVDWLADQDVTNVGPNQRAYATWNIDFGGGTITDAEFRIDKNGASFAYGIPAGATLDFALITEPWSSTTPDSSNTGPSVGTTPVTEFVQVTAPADDPFTADITSLIVNWQANPTAYFGVRMFVSAGAERGGMWAPNETGDSTGITANLLLDQTPIPEPTALGAVALGGLALSRRRRRG